MLRQKIAQWVQREINEISLSSKLLNPECEEPECRKRDLAQHRRYAHYYEDLLM